MHRQGVAGRGGDSASEPLAGIKAYVELLVDGDANQLDRVYRCAARHEVDVVIIVDTDPAARSDIRQQLRPRGFAIVVMQKDGSVGFRRPSPRDVREIVRGIEKPPAGVSWQEYAFRRSTDANPFPSMMGRVCPAPCQEGCNRNEVEDFVVSGFECSPRSSSSGGREGRSGLRFIEDFTHSLVRNRPVSLDAEWSERPVVIEHQYPVCRPRQPFPELGQLKPCG